MGSEGPYVGAQDRETLLPGGTVSIKPRCIDQTLSSKFYPGRYAVLNAMRGRFSVLLENWRIISFCVAPGDWTVHTSSLRDHRTWADVEDCLAYGKTGDETHIDAVWRRGRQAAGRYRNISATERVATSTWNTEHAKKYVERILGLATLIQRRGGVPSPSELDAQFGRADDEIGVVIGASGELLHFRKGHHRLIIAKQLEIECVKVEPLIVHAGWLKDAHGLGEGADGVRETVRKHMERFG